jgi:hypothetical protein
VTPDPVLIGGLAPLTPPGWVAAGRQLLAGLQRGVRDVNAAGGVDGRPLELLVRDTAADPERAAAAVDELAALGVAAVAGEFHSVVARAAAARADALDLPFLCSSAVLDALVDRPTDRVARLAPPQSRGWRVYADFLRAEGHEHVAVLTQPSAYWAAGVRILRDALPVVVETDVAGLPDTGATAVLLLVGHPEPALSIVGAIRGEARLADVLIGAPAGQPELPEWAALGADIPFLRYLPEHQRAPSFVALEGHDAILVVAEALRTGGGWGAVAVDGTRGPIRFTRPPGVDVWQWTWPPIQVADRDPAHPDHFRVRHVG